MPIAQFAEHCAQHLKQLVVTHRVVYARGIAQAHLIPVEPVLLLLVVEEAVVLVHNPPQGLEVATRRIGILLLIDTRRKRGDGRKHDKK